MQTKLFYGISIGSIANGVPASSPLGILIIIIGIIFTIGLPLVMIFKGKK